ncbi:YciE/YciF ferroxidase family protein [Sphingobacterium hotanense]|uniref:YciE/YciF ferroxidase family protein n=1 Tax=Sphingobacterium hotanense TaxID=649196 RepID=UPI0011F11CC0|nr:ferritin-like domain-containing protein [Sphingobacterium hotanense]
MAKQKDTSKQANAHLHELFVDELRDILGAERQLLKGLKKMENAAQSEQLKDAFKTHYQQTEGQIERLKSVFEELGMSARGKKCKAMEGLLAEAEEIIEEFQDDADVIDAALIAAAQKVEHYEIASYGCVVTYAKLMGHKQAQETLFQTLEEEKQTDSLLTDIALSSANKK